MTTPAIPTAAQIRAMPVTSVKALRKALKDAGLRVVPGGAHLRVETADGRFIGGVPITPSCPHALLNCRSYLAKRCEAIRAQRAGGNG